MATDENENGVLDEEEIERLDEIAAHPYNINTITQDQLEDFPFLDDEEVSAIALYLYRYKSMMTLLELNSIPQLSMDKIALLRCFLYCGEKEKKDNLNIANILKYGKHELYYGGRVPLYERKGDVTDPYGNGGSAASGGAVAGGGATSGGAAVGSSSAVAGGSSAVVGSSSAVAGSSTAGGYLGSSYRQQLRYSFNYNNRVRIGLVGANDAGEQFFSGRNAAGFDYYSFYLQAKGIRLSESLTIENVVLGRYRAGFGMGLVLNNNFSLGKSSMMSSAGRISSGFRPHSGSSDANYLQGAAATFSIKRRKVNQNGGIKGSEVLNGGVNNSFDISLFASHRLINATVQNDTISTILSSSYHRTVKEMEKKNSASQSSLGADISYSTKHLSVGIAALYSHLNIPLMPDKRQAYRKYYAQGQNFFNASAHYSYITSKLSFRGETAIAPIGQACDGYGDGNGNGNSGFDIAAVHSLSYRPKYGCSLSLLHRYYGQKYTSMYGRSFSESTSLQDEHGIYASIVWRFSNTFSAQYYADYAHFQNPKYQVSSASNMVENVLYLTWQKKNWTVTMRGRVKNRQYDSADKKWLVWKNNASLRIQCDYAQNEKEPTKGWTAKLLAQYSHYDKDTVQSNGYVAQGSVSVPLCSWLTVDGSIAYFDTDDYYSAIYAYERGMSYGMNYNQMYGEGVRWSLLLRSRISKKISAALKIGSTKYFDRKKIGSGMDEILSSAKTDIDFQVRWRF